MSQIALIIHMIVVVLLASLLGVALVVSSFSPAVIRNNNFTMWVHPEERVTERTAQWL